MQGLHKLKFGFNRSLALSTALINAKELILLGVILGAVEQKKDGVDVVNIYHDIFEVFGYQNEDNAYFLLGVFGLNILVAISLILTLGFRIKQLYFLLPMLSIFIKLFPYLFSVLAFNFSFYATLNGIDLITRLIALVNVPFLLGYLILHEFINQSLKFRQVDFCNQRIGSFTSTILVPAAILILHVLGPFYALLCCSLRALHILLSLLSYSEFVLLQRLKSFYALLTFYFTFIEFLVNFKLLVDSDAIYASYVKLVVVAVGVGASWMLSNQAVGMIWRRMLESARGLVEDGGQGQTFDTDQPPLVRIENEIKILVQAFLQRERHLLDQQNSYSYFWREFSQIVFTHKLKCEQPKCLCKKPKEKSIDEVESQLFVSNLMRRVAAASERMGKEMRLKVMSIYLLIEIAKKPLKGYFELILLKKQKIKAKLQLQIEDLVSISRECFDQIFFKNKVRNQQLNLLKVISLEQTIKSLEDDLRNTFIFAQNFLDIFTYSTLKMGQVQSEANRLAEMKKGIEKKIESLITDCAENPSVVFSMYTFYRYLEPFRSREVEFKKMASQQALKKRLLLKAEGQSVTSDSGIIYIDLVQDRGRIKKLTQNICEWLGYAREDMVGFNINLFMPTMFGKNHGKFLSNFIDKGRIKLLKQKERMVLAKNKKKFLIPINARLKAEHLLDNQFGASALITPIDTNSDFIITGKNGRVEDITQGIYNRIFGKVFREDVQKIARVCVYKLLPGLNQVIQGWDEGIVSKIHEGLMIYSEHEDYLLQKFKHNREASYSSMGLKSKSSSMSLISNSTFTYSSVAKSERFQYFSQLFKAFLLDINPKKLKAFKVSYKYSRIKTSEFEVELVEIITCKEDLQGRVFMRELLNELSNAAEVFQLLDEQSPISQHLAMLQENVESQYSIKNPEPFSTEMKLSGKERNLSQIRDETLRSNHNSEDEPFEDDMDEQKHLNPQNSETGSVTGNNESESKKQLLINAFNSSEDVISTGAIVCTVLAILSLVTLLLAMTFIQLMSIDRMEDLWLDSSYVLGLRMIFEYRVSLAELQRFGSNMNIVMPAQIALQQANLNNRMVILAKSLINSTYSTAPQNSPFSFATPLFDPSLNITYDATFPQSVTKLTQLFTQSSAANRDTVQHNYEGLHTNFHDFYNQRMKFFRAESEKLNVLMTALLVMYEVLIGLVALSAIPIYIYFKQQQLEVRSKLAFMNIREIKRATGNLHLVLDYLKQQASKSSINRLQHDMNEQKFDKQEQIGGSKVIKITSESQNYTMLTNPWTYCLLLLFIVFFSNLSIGLFVIFNQSNTFFLNALEAHKLANDLQIKTPLMINIYVSNLNRALEGKSFWVFDQSLRSQSESDFYQLMSTLTLPSYQGNNIVELIKNSTTKSICSLIVCAAHDDSSMQEISQEFKHRFDFWRASNEVSINLAVIQNWLLENSIMNVLGDLLLVMNLSLAGQTVVTDSFKLQENWWWRLAVLLSAILIPINVLGLIIILRRYLLQVNQMVRSAQQLYMNFPVQVLVENTYLTSYFTAKIKSGK